MRSTTNKILFAVLILGTIMRFWGLATPDVINDEALIGFRSIGLIDYLASPSQPTTWERLDPIPAWAHLTNHDHPQVVFWLQHWSMKLFGVGTFGLRLPSALFGLLSVFLLYLIGKKLFDTKVGLLTAALAAFNIYFVWVSKIGLQEAILLGLILSAVYFGIGYQEQKYNLYLAFVFAGLAVMAKYTGIAALILILVWFWLTERKIYRTKKPYLGLVLFFLIVSPILIYNIALYQTIGHFDLQFSFLFGQSPAEWQNLPGKEQIGGLGQRLADFGRNVFANGSYIFAVVAATSLIYSILHFKNAQAKKPIVFLYSAMVLNFSLLMIIGARERFLVMLYPYLCLLVAVTVLTVYEKYSKTRTRVLSIALLATFLGFEALYSFNTTIATYPQGSSPWTYSALEADNRPWGYDQLDEYLNQELKGSYPEFQLPLRQKFLEDIKAKTILKAKDEGKASRKLMIIYDENIHNNAALWYVLRRVVYEGWPIIPAQTYLELTGSDPEFFKKSGFAETWFIKATDNTLLEHQRSPYPQSLEDGLTNLVMPIDIVKAPNGETAFKIYKF